MTLSYHGLVARLRPSVREVTTADLADRMDRPPLLIDIREPDEVRSGVIPGSYHVPRGVLEGVIGRIVVDPSAEVLLICAGGNRSVLAAASLQAMGFTDVASLAGGVVQWRREGHPILVPGTSPTGPADQAPLDVDDEARYARHLVLEGVGRNGQRRIGAASVLVVGLGGLGSPVGLFLAAAGIGRLGLVDPDVVDISNLQRQVIHDTTRLGSRKVDSAALTIERLNPGVGVERHPVPLAAANALELMAGYDVVVDATDSFPSRYLINDAALHLGVPVVHGSVYRFEGQATVFLPHRGPCYRCLFPLPPPPELAPNCAEAGVLGVLPGTIGSIQATEVLKLVLGVGDTLAGTLLTYDAREATFRRLGVRRDPACAACSDESRLPLLVDYDVSCAPRR
jgi:molybdopterin/thiamine biosynthesis adenylyltransferase/rhodanese-related sulfurtransferase